VPEPAATAQGQGQRGMPGGGPAQPPSQLVNYVIADLTEEDER
jgi:hypothetical protein